MFDGFDEAKDEQANKRWFASGGVSLIIYVAVGAAFLHIARQTVTKATAESPIDVTFRGSVHRETAPPPPPPPPPKATAPRAKRPGKPAPARPTMIPEQRPDEGDPTGGVTGVAFEEFGDGDVVGALFADPPPPPPPPKLEPVPEPIDEVDPSVTAAKAFSENASPEYPQAARRKGLEAEVILRITISVRGEVTDVQVLSGDEPFASSAVAAVKTWRYRPASVDGRPVPVRRKIKIPFRIQA